MAVRAVIFDLDGTLVDTIEDIVHAGNIMFKRHGYPERTREDFIQWIGNGAVKLIELGLGEKVEEDQLLTYVNEFKQIYSQHYAVKSRIYDDIPEVLNTLRNNNLKISILSNKPHGLTVQVTESYLSKWNIEPVFGQREEVPRKPDPAGALEIAQIIGIPPSDIMLVGDSEGDIKTAMAAGMIPVGVTWGYGNVSLASQNGFDTIDTPKEFLKLLDK